MEAYVQPLPTKEILYRGAKYYIDGKLDGKAGTFWYILQFPNGEAIKSAEFATATLAGQDARRAIDDQVSAQPASVVTPEAVATAKRGRGRQSAKRSGGKA